MEEEPQEELHEEEMDQHEPAEKETVEKEIPEPEVAEVSFVEEDDVLDEVEDVEEDRPAVVINVGSWGTLVVGLVMLLVGIAGGLAGRSILDSFNSNSAASSEVTESPAAATTDAPDEVIAQIPSVTPQQPSPQDQEQLMSFLESQTKHFFGDPDAPVTIIEFSDFQ